MAKSKIVEANKTIEKAVLNSYSKIEDAVVKKYEGIENVFVNAFLAEDGESVEEAKKRIRSSLDDGKEGMDENWIT